MDSPPSFWVLFADALRLSASKRSILAFIPWWLLSCCLVPVATVYFVGPLTRGSIADNEAVTMLSAVAVVGGFFGSVSIATMAQVQRMSSEYPFSAYLKEENMFDLFLFWPQFTLMVQISLILFSTCTALIVRLVEAGNWSKYLLALDVGLLIYVCTKTWNMIDLVRKLTWHYEDYNRLLEEEKRRPERQA